MAVDILMATYNGERYLCNQLLSLQQQTYKNWTLWVRDDGSTDGTVRILREFAKIDSRIRIVENSPLERLGPGRGFMRLTRYSTAEYVAFCDQDDIWFEKKLEALVQFAEDNFSPELPCVVYCDAYGYSDTEGVITIDGVSRWHANTLRDFLFFNAGYQGCSMLINRTLCRMLANYRASYFYMHDDVASLLAHSFGRVYFLPKKLMLYRQHSFNVTGNIERSSRAQLRRVFDRKLYVLSARHYKEKESFFDAYKDSMDDYTRQLFVAYLAFPKQRLHNRLFLVVRNGFTIGGSKLRLLLKTLIRRPIG